MTIDDREVYLIKSPTEITKTNFRTLTFLEAVRLISFSNQDKLIISILEDYIRKYRITLSQVQKYCAFFPDAVSKKILSSDLIRLLASIEHN